jgi:O-antigen ligase
MQMQALKNKVGFFRDGRKGDFLFILFLVILSFQMPISVGAKFEFSLVEVFVLMVASLFLRKLDSEKVNKIRVILKTDPIAWVLIAWSLWGVVVWSVERNWAYGINETRWVFLSTIGYILLRYIFSYRWEDKLKILFAVSVVIALIADLQGLTGIFSPPFTSLPEKEFFFSLTGGITHTVAVGFFKHPNAFGGFIYWPLLLSFGLIFEKKSRMWGIVLFLLFGFSLMLSNYRTLILGIALAIVLITLIRMNLSSKRLIGIFLALCIVSAFGFIGFYVFNQNSSFFANFTFRVLLWFGTMPVFATSVQTMIIGLGAIPIGTGNSIAIVDPHNAYLYMLVHYGFPGLIILCALIGIIITRGWKMYRTGVLQTHPMTQMLWIGFLVWFITSLVDSRLSTAEWQFQLVFLAALFMGKLPDEEVGSNKKIDLP